MLLLRARGRSSESQATTPVAARDAARTDASAVSPNVTPGSSLEGASAVSPKITPGSSLEGSSGNAFKQSSSGASTGAGMESPLEPGLMAARAADPMAAAAAFLPEASVEPGSTRKPGEVSRGVVLSGEVASEQGSNKEALGADVHQGALLVPVSVPPAPPCPLAPTAPLCPTHKEKDVITTMRHQGDVAAFACRCACCSHFVVLPFKLLFLLVLQAFHCQRRMRW
jgi:hypothetical protein